DARRVFRLRLPNLPQRVSGDQRFPYMGVDEAQGLWDLHGRCIVVSDGGSPLLFVQRVGFDAVDALHISLPEARERSSRDEQEVANRFGGLGAVPEPALRKRVWQFVVDPDGWA